MPCTDAGNWAACDAVTLASNECQQYGDVKPVQASYIRTMEQVLSVTCTCSDRACAVWRFVLRCLVQTFHERFFRNMCKYLSHTYAHTCTYLFACMLAFQIKMKMLPPRCKDSKTIKWVTSQSMKSSDVGEVEKHLCGWNWNPLYIYVYMYKWPKSTPKVTWQPDWRLNLGCFPHIAFLTMQG